MHQDRPNSRLQRSLILRKRLILGFLFSIPTFYSGSLMAETITVESCRALAEQQGRMQTNRQSVNDPKAPEISTGYRLNIPSVATHRAAVVTANPHATQAGCQVLLQGGTAADAAIAVQFTLGLVEPQSSGLGGGGFLLYYDAATQQVTAYDGRETAPAAATPDYLRWVKPGDASSGAPLPNVRRSGRSIGVPGVVKMLGLVHAQHGKLSWQEITKFSKQLAQNGFTVSPRLHQLIVENQAFLQDSAESKQYFFDAQGQPLPVGSVKTNPAYAEILEQIARKGAEGFYQPKIIEKIVASVQQTRSADGTLAITPGEMTANDIQTYQPIVRSPVCSIYRNRFEICGMPPPASGGIAIAQALGILEALPHDLPAPTDLDANGGLPHPQSVHLVAEALNIAFADRNKYVSDWGQGFNAGLVLPTIDQMITKEYLQSRAQEIQLNSAMNKAKAGSFPQVTTHLTSSAQEGVGTTHISIVDPQGNAVAFTSTVEGAFGSYHMTNGFLLNNQMTDFSVEPNGSDGPIANRIEAGKRPRSSMSPTLVFSLNKQGKRDQLVLVTGSPGGAAIIAYTLKSIVATLDWNLNAQQAAGIMNFNAMNAPVDGQTIPTLILDADHPAMASVAGQKHPLVQALTSQFGRPQETIRVGALNSGISTIVRQPDSAKKTIWLGGADPRREGLVLGF